jgi:hypothetical protein
MARACTLRAGYAALACLAAVLGSACGPSISTTVHESSSGEQPPDEGTSSTNGTETTDGHDEQGCRYVWDRTVRPREAKLLWAGAADQLLLLGWQLQRLNGEQWTIIYEGIHQPQSLWASSVHDAWYVSAWDLWHLQGDDVEVVSNGWSAVWGRAADDVWVVGGTPMCEAARVQRYDGQTWADSSVPAVPGCLTGIHGNANRLVAIGRDQNLVLWHDGSAWSQDANAPERPTSVWVTPEGMAYLVARDGVFTSDGGAWQVLPELDAPVAIVRGSSGHDIYAVFAPQRNRARLMHFDGLIWSVLDTPRDWPQASSELDAHAFDDQLMVVSHTNVWTRTCTSRGRPAPRTAAIGTCEPTCAVASDCCSPTAGPTCPDSPPNRWACEHGLCTYQGCDSDDECPNGRPACLLVGEIRDCKLPCESAADCPGDQECIESLERTRYCSSPEPTWTCVSDDDLCETTGVCNHETGRCSCASDDDCGPNLGCRL